MPIESSSPSILLIAGDVSGDVNTAALARTLLERNPDLTLHAVGGRRLREIVSTSPGGQFLADTTNCSAIGITSAIKLYFRCRRLGYLVLDFVRTNRVDVAILCDWGGFNGRMLPRLQALGIPVLYYFPPRSWDRNGSGGGLGIVSQVTRVATPFQWSAERLRRAGAQADWVGHPSLERIPAEQERPRLRASFGTGSDERLVALLPGSRPSELRVLAPRIAKAAALVGAQTPVRFVAAVPKELLAEARSYLPSEIRVTSDCSIELLQAADAAVVKTGTATLEAALTDTPQVAVYDVSMIGRVEWCLLWAWRHIPFIAMPNIILQRKTVPELIGLNCRPEKIARELIELLNDDGRREKMRSDYALIRRALGSDLLVAPTERTAQIVEEMLDEILARSESAPYRSRSSASRGVAIMRGKVRLFHLVSYLGFRLGEAWIRLLPIEFLFILGRIGGALAYGLFRRRRAIALRNLRLAFGGEMSEAQLREVARRHFQLLGANLLAGLKSASLSDDEIWSRVTANEPPDPGKAGCVVLTSHTGNWELYSHLARHYGDYRFGAIYQPLANPLIDRYLRASRAKAGIKLFDRRKQLLSGMRFLRNGGVVGVLADQGAGNAGIWTPLFRRLTSSSTLAARMSVSTGLPIVPVAITTTGCARWRMTISDPIYPGDDRADVLTAKLNRVLEEQICRSPADWLWAHNRWKPLRPHFLFAREQRRVFFPPDFDPATLDPFRILIVSPATPEKARASFPAVQAIKQGRPDNSVTVLTLDRLADTWKTNQAVDHVIAYNENESVFAIAAKIRGRMRFDVSIFLDANWRLSLAFWIVGIPLRVGPRSGINGWLCNQHPAEPAESLDPAAMNLHIAQSVGADINAARW